MLLLQSFISISELANPLIFISEKKKVLAYLPPFSINEISKVKNVKINKIISFYFSNIRAEIQNSRLRFIFIFMSTQSAVLNQ